MLKAQSLLEASLIPVKTELNDLDWKAALSPDKNRLAEHLSAFSNQTGGGFLVYGMDSFGNAVGVKEQDVQFILNHLANIGRQALEPPVVIDHALEKMGAVAILFVFITESSVKPVHLRGRGLEGSYIRSGGTTRRASRQEIGNMMLNSRVPRWEQLRASPHLQDEELISRLNADGILTMLQRPMPSNAEEKLVWMANENFIEREPCGGGYVTNLGAVAAAHRIADFPDLSRKALRIIVYDGLNKSKAKGEQEGIKGYAVGFQGILQFLAASLPQSEVIEKALRVQRTVYPIIALRELVANALIHQDFSIGGAGPMIEIFNDRIEISNPGSLLPSKQIDRLIGTQPESRNENLARAFRRYQICEERGSGLLKAGIEIEIYGLPPMEFEAGSNYFKATLFSPRSFAEMSPRERLEACYQHAVLKYYSDNALTNTSLRERLKMPARQTSMVSNLIREAVERGRIKAASPENKSTKFAKYVPFWA